ncbi:MAG TPA: heterodisulfide reductase-related iron-sulfur binding cluster [Gemmatimonadales bacterium]|nr:heterodisulfide reductase-related iron-sulfur binding cluster [Gemmatimonadales bacterium]
MPMADPVPNFTALDPCVHCGLCLPACPTYTATGDESDSPRGRIVLMRALERGEISAQDEGLRTHLDRCLGCRGCEPACPSGVGYGRGLQVAREILTRENGITPKTRAVLAMFGHRALWRAAFGGAKLLRGLGIAKGLSGSGRLGSTMGMVAATKPSTVYRRQSTVDRRPSISRGTVVLFRGCVMDVLFRHVHEATRRTLAANGFEVVDVRGQACCGAPHEHAGDAPSAKRLAAKNVAALADSADAIVVDSAGCGAMLRDYHHLLGDSAAERFAAKVRDVSELLAEAGPVTGAPVARDVAYDAPCHLQHAQKVHAQPVAVLRSIPELRLRLLPGYDRCCGGAGAYSMLQAEMSAAVLADKVASIRDAAPRPDFVATGNPGCIMQIGAGLNGAGVDIPVVHPVELLDLSYATGGLYG